MLLNIISLARLQDQEVLPPPIKFSIGNSELPSSQGSHFGQENIQGSVCLFLQQWADLNINLISENLIKVVVDLQ